MVDTPRPTPALKHSLRRYNPHMTPPLRLARLALPLIWLVGIEACRPAPIPVTRHVPTPVPPFEMAAADRHLEDLQAQLAAAGIHLGEVRRLRHTDAFSLWVGQVPGAEAIVTWRRLRELSTRLGAWPVLVGAPTEVDELTELAGTLSDNQVERTIREGVALDTDAWLASRRASDRETYEPPRDGAARRGLTAATRPKPNQSFTIHTDILSGKVLRTVAIVLVPTSRSWEVPAFVAYGGWNDCPETVAHVGLLKRWHDTNGAELVGLGRDTVELGVSHPITTREEALARADEQFVFCYDIVHQGTGTLDRLADEISGASVWYFWWD